MKNMALIFATALLALTAPMISLAAMDHGSHNTHTMGGAAHEEVVDGVKVTFSVRTMADAMKEMGMEMPKGVKETHHISVVFKDVKSRKPLTEGTVKIKVQNPDKTDQTRDLTGMHGHFGADFDLAKKGRYGVMCKFRLGDGMTRSTKFWYEVK